MALKVEQCQLGGLPITLSPHVLIQVGRQHVTAGADHCFEVAIDSAPVSFDVVCARARVWVLEVLAVIHSLMLESESGQLTVSRPLIGPDHCAWLHAALDYRQQCGRIPCIHQLDIPHLVSGIINAEDPLLLLVQLVTAVVLGLHHDRLINLDDLAGTAELYRSAE